jgi:hypothetical protein
VTDNRAARDPTREAARRRSHLFVVRLWREEAAGGPEYRGSVRDVVSGAFRHFRAWPDLTAFLVAWVEEAEGAPPAPSAGERHGDGGGGA